MEIKTEKKKYENDNLDVQLQKHLGSKYSLILEVNRPSTFTLAHTSAWYMQLWRYRDKATYTEFVRSFYLQSQNEKKYPIISCVLKNEQKLSYIKYAADVLAWHAILFKVYKPGSITRQDAAVITNTQAIELLPVDEQEQAKVTLVGYCTAFNQVLTLPGNLRECASNIFIDKNTGEVDLLGYSDDNTTTDSTTAMQVDDEGPAETRNEGRLIGEEGRKIGHEGRKMGPDTPIVYSLPSSLKQNNEFLDPRSLCTIFILEQLEVCY